MSQVCAWLDAGGAIDAKDGWGYTLVASCAFGKEIEGEPGARIIIEEEVALARNLIGRGANVNIDTGMIMGSRRQGWSPLHLACRNIRTNSAALSTVATTRTRGSGRSAATRRRRAGAWRFVAVPPSRARRRRPTGDGPSRGVECVTSPKKFIICLVSDCRGPLPSLSLSRSRHNWSTVAVPPCTA